MPEDEDDIPTTPELPFAQLRCPECDGAGSHTCPLCHGEAMVTRAQFRAFHGRRQGRPQ